MLSGAVFACVEGSKQSCFLPDQRDPAGVTMCTEGTRECRAGAWSACENTQKYPLTQLPDTQRLVDPSAGNPTCSLCDISCFQVIDTLSQADGLGDSDLTFASGGGLTLPTAAAPVASDGGVVTPGCSELDRCCAGFSGALNSACMSVASGLDDAKCAEALSTYCPSGEISGPRTDCTLGTGEDSDCDGIPNVVDETVGPPLPGTSHRTIFHQLDIGETGDNTLDVGYKLSNADVYILFDATGTMASERQNLSDLLTTSNVVHCAQLAQCCGGDATCSGIAGRNNPADCYDAQPAYCGSHVDCADVDFDGLPNNELVEQGVVGGVRCLVGSSWFGLGSFREIPVHAEPETDRCPAEGCRYGDRDEHLFRHWVDMTSDHERVRDALTQMSMNYNWDEPEGGMLALHSVVTGRGHYFGMHRPAVPDRSGGEDCAPDTFGYPCFRSDAIPVVVMFTDAPQHRGPADFTSCNGRGLGCPYADLSSANYYQSSSSDSASDRTAHYVPISAEAASSAFDVGDVRGRYLTLVGDTSPMTADYAASATGCGAADDAPDALVRFEVSSGREIEVNFHLTKDDAYSSSYYGAWTPWGLTAGTDDPTPATDFGSVVTVYRGSPDDLSSSARRLTCKSDAQPVPLSGSNWHERSVDFKLDLGNGTYYVSIKGVSASDAGRFQLQLGQTSARVATEYRPPSWSETRSALVDAGVRVLPVLATGSVANAFVPAAEAQARALALASGAVRADGTPIWYRMQNDSAETGKAIVNSMAELARHLAMDVSIEAVDGPDPGASLFGVQVSPRNSPGCLQPHPLVDDTAACDDTSTATKCNVQYACRPGATPSFRVSFTHPPSAPVPPNPSDPYGGYLFKLQLKGDGKYLLSEIPVYLLPTTRDFVVPAVETYESQGTYEQTLLAANCVGAQTALDAGRSGTAQLLASWGDAYFHADLPEDTSIDFQLCTADSDADLAACDWDESRGGQRKVSVAAHGACSVDADCADVSGYGTGSCTAGLCRFITPNKVWSDLSCSADSDCPNGPLGAGDYVIQTRCETDSSSPSFGRCISTSPPLDLGSSLRVGQDGRPHAKVRITLNAHPSQASAPTLFDWYLTYRCQAAQ